MSIEGQDYVPSVIGPMTRSFNSLSYITKAVIEAEPWRLDPKCLPIPWRESVYQEARERALVIGIMADDGVVKVHPPIERVLKEMAEKLRAAGHEIVNWTAEGHAEYISIMVREPFCWEVFVFQCLTVMYRTVSTLPTAGKTFGETSN